MRHASLFSGIGGFDLAAQWMGWENVFQVEIDKFCQRVLEKNFPNVTRYGDIKEFDGTKYRGTIDVLSGGFPCQPYSAAGKREGKKDPRHLWPEYDRIIGEIRPSIVVGENVRGLLNWNGGLVFDEVLSDLENKGYEVAPFLLPACGLNAPHRRDRIWIIAHSTSVRCEGGESKGEALQWAKLTRGEISASDYQKTTPNLEGKGFTKGRICGRDKTEQSEHNYGTPSHDWNLGKFEPFVGRGVHGISHRVDRIKGLGNAIVPQVAFEIFKAIESIK